MKRKSLILAVVIVLLAMSAYAYAITKTMSKPSKAPAVGMVAIPAELVPTGTALQPYSPAWGKGALTPEGLANACLQDPQCAAVMTVSAAQQSARDGKPSQGSPTAWAQPFMLPTGDTIKFSPREYTKGPTTYVRSSLKTLRV